MAWEPILETSVSRLRECSKFRRPSTGKPAFLPAGKSACLPNISVRLPGAYSGNKIETLPKEYSIEFICNHKYDEVGGYSEMPEKLIRSSCIPDCRQLVKSGFFQYTCVCIPFTVVAIVAEYTTGLI